MPTLNKLTPEQANQIQNEKINSLIVVSEKELDPFINVSSLNAWFLEIPPININSKNDLKLLLAGVDASDMTGKLQWIYLKTYLNDGLPTFRKDGKGNCEINLDFSQGRRLHEDFTPTNNKLEIDGKNELRSLWFLQLYCDVNLMMVPSISFKITIDGKAAAPQSVSLLINKMQAIDKIGVINTVYSNFNKLVFEVIYNNPEVQNPIRLAYI